VLYVGGSVADNEVEFVKKDGDEVLAISSKKLDKMR